MPVSVFALSALQQLTASDLVFRVREPRPPSPPRRCLVLLHGVGGNESDLLDLAADVDAETLVVFPRAPLPVGVDEYAWFRVIFSPNGPKIDAAQAEASRRALIHFVAGVQVAYRIAAQQTVIAGFSQGGIIAASVALSAPERIRGLAILCARILPEIAPVLAAREQLRGLQAFIAHGETDTTLPVSWAQRSAALLAELGVEHALRLYPTGHALSAAMQVDFQEWLRTLA